MACVLRKSCAAALVACFVWVSGVSSAQDAQVGLVEERLVEGIAVYQEAMGLEDRDGRLEAFGRAQRLFESVIENSEARNAELYANLGNAALGAQRLGDAVVAYRRALALDPGHVRARQNLKQARRLVPGWVPKVGDGSEWDTFFFWRGIVSASVTVLMGACVFGVGAILVGISIRYRQGWARNLGGVLILGWLGLGVLEMWEAGGGGGAMGGGGWRVVIAHEAVGRAADAVNAPPRFAEPLPSGAEGVLIEERGEWAHLRLADGRDAWLLGSALGGPE